MDDVAKAIFALEEGDPAIASELFPLVYDELRRLAAKQLSNETPGQTLQPTALVHEAYIRLVGRSPDQAPWSSLNLFFGAAAEVMRRILIDRARRKHAVKRGGNARRIHLSSDQIPAQLPDEDLIAIDEAVSQFEIEHPEKAQVIKLRFFAGMNNAETAAVMGISPATTQRHWTFARVWLFNHLKEST